VPFCSDMHCRLCVVLTRRHALFFVAGKRVLSHALADNMAASRRLCEGLLETPLAELQAGVQSGKVRRSGRHAMGRGLGWFP